ncbi:MAG: DUF116 domain-containing protein [Deltaproteobacteria bacterium]
MPTIIKVKLICYLLLFPFRNLLKLFGVRYDIEKVTNAFYFDDFQNIPAEHKAVFLPHCLTDEKCQAKFSKINGVLCVNCKRCRCGEIKELCEERGLQFYISPSINFTRRLSTRKNIKAAIGVACGEEIEKGIRRVKFTFNGVSLKKKKVIPQMIVTQRQDCLENLLDWEKLKTMIINPCRPNL